MEVLSQERVQKLLELYEKALNEIVGTINELQEGRKNLIDEGIKEGEIV